MAKKSNNQEQILEDRIIQKILRTQGHIFPETVEEVELFEKKYGKTEIILPDTLQFPNFLFTKNEKKKIIAKIVNPNENFAMAAREGSTEISIEIKNKIIEDIKKAKKKKKE